MSTAGAVKSIGSGIASQGGGLRSSVTNSIKSSPVRMISIGPEGGRARVDTSFGNPFSRMRPANPSLNPGGKIFGENGPTRPRTAESVFGPEIGTIKFNSPVPKVRFTPEAASKADISTTFAKARARNQVQVAERKANDVKEAEAFIASVLPNVRIPNPNRAIDFRGFQTIPQVKEPTQERPAKTRFNQAELKTISQVEKPSSAGTDLNKLVTRPQVKLNIQELASTIARLRTVSSQSGETRFQVNSVLEANKMTGGRTSRLVEALQARSKGSAEFKNQTRIVNALRAEIPLVQPKIDTQPLEDTTVRNQKVNDEAGLQSNVQKNPVTGSVIEKVTQNQQDLLVVMAPLIKEGDQLAKEQIFRTIGVNPKTAEAVLNQPVIASKVESPKGESKSLTKEQTILQQAATVVRFIESVQVQKASPALRETIENQSQAEKAQQVVEAINQTQRLTSLGLSDTDLNPLIERQLGSLTIENRKKLALQIITEVRLTKNQTEIPSKRSELQRDSSATKARVEVGTEAVDLAVSNDLGDVSSASAAEILIAKYKKPVISTVAVLADRATDGSYDRIILAVKGASKWLKRTALAQIIDQAIEANPAVIEVQKRLDKAVTEEDKEKVLDRSLRQLVNSLMLPMSFEDKVKGSFTSRLS